MSKDVRDGLLLITFHAADQHLEQSHGVIGCCHLCDSGFSLSAIGLVEAVKYILAKLWFVDDLNLSSSDGCDSAWRDVEASQQVLRGVCGKVEVLCADAASDECLGAKILDGTRGNSPLFPAVKMRAYDRAHACRRVLQRAWLADDYLSATVSRLIFAPQAVLQLIRHSVPFKSRFLQYTKTVAGLQGQRIRDLASAKHRFESHSKPLGRAVMWFPALMRTCQSIIDERPSGSKEVDAAKQWLQHVDEERALTIATLADAGDETMDLLRFLDGGDGYDFADLSNCLLSFRERITWLFCEPSLGALQCGYTAYMLQCLQSPMAIFSSEGVRQVGGPNSLSQETQARVFRFASQPWPPVLTTMSCQPFSDDSVHLPELSKNNVSVNRDIVIFTICPVMLLPTAEAHGQLDRASEAHLGC